MTEFLDLDDLLELAAALLGDPPPIRDLGLLAAAAERPRASAFGEDAYPDIWTKAAALMQSLLKNHPLVDGNKRLAWLGTAVFLGINGHPMTSPPNDAVYELVMEIAAGHHEVSEIAARLRALPSD